MTRFFFSWLFFFARAFFVFALAGSGFVSGAAAVSAGATLDGIGIGGAATFVSWAEATMAPAAVTAVKNQ
jgi:hypothetical protein